MPAARHTPRAALERRIMGAMVDDAELRAAVFRFVDVRPACADPADSPATCSELLAEAEDSPLAGAAPRWPAARSPRAPSPTRRPPASSRWRSGSSSAPTRRDALPAVQRLWRDGVATTIDLLGEATVTEDEADSYADALRGDAARAARGVAGLAAAPAAGARRRRPAAARQPLGQGLGAHAAAALRRARARHRGRASRGCAACCASPATPARTCTSTWSPSTRARRSPS